MAPIVTTLVLNLRSHVFVRSYPTSSKLPRLTVYFFILKNKLNVKIDEGMGGYTKFRNALIENKNEASILKYITLFLSK